MNLSFRVGGFNIGLRVSYNPIETYGVGSLTPYGHMTFVDLDDVKHDLKFIVNRVKYDIETWGNNYIGCAGFIVLRSSKNSYHLIDPSITCVGNVIEKMSDLSFGKYAHIGMGLILGKWVLRVGKKADKGNPVIVGVIPGDLTEKLLVYRPMIDLLNKMPKDDKSASKFGMVKFDEWYNGLGGYRFMSGPLLFDKYATVARRSIRHAPPS